VEKQNYWAQAPKTARFERKLVFKRAYLFIWGTANLKKMYLRRLKILRRWKQVLLFSFTKIRPVREQKHDIGFFVKTLQFILV